MPGGALTLMTDGDVPLESEKWTLSDTNFDKTHTLIDEFSGEISTLLGTKSKNFFKDNLKKC